MTDSFKKFSIARESRFRLGTDTGLKTVMASDSNYSSRKLVIFKTSLTSASMTSGIGKKAPAIQDAQHANNAGGEKIRMACQSPFKGIVRVFRGFFTGHDMFWNCFSKAFERPLMACEKAFRMFSGFYRLSNDFEML